MKEIRQEDLIVIENINKASENTSNRLEVDSGYIPIRLSTKGKLGTPEIIHFRNFNINEIIELATIKEEDEKIFALVKCLNKMIFEKDIKCENMHGSEIIEILLNIYFTFNNLEIGPYKYYINEDLDDEELNKKDNIGSVNFTSKDFNIIPILDEFKEPINIKDKNNGNIYKFRLPRINDNLIAREYILEKYKEQKEKFIEVEWTLKQNQSKYITDKKKIDENIKKEYEEFLKKMDIDYIKLCEAQIIIGDKDNKFSLEESYKKIENNEIPLDVFIAFNEVTKKMKFGINEEISFKQEDKNFVRRFSFQPFDFIPSMESTNNNKYDISFGD